MKLFKGSLLLKITALVMALLTYFYIHNLIKRNDRKTADPSYKLFKPTTRNLPIHVRIGTSPPEGYRILAEKVTANPSKIFAVGPEVLLDSAPNAETALVDVSDSTKTVVKKIPLDSIAGIPLTGERFIVEVTIPIEKTE